MLEKVNGKGAAKTQVTFRNLPHADDETSRQVISPFSQNTRADIIRSPKSVALENDKCPPQNSNPAVNQENWM